MYARNSNAITIGNKLRANLLKNEQLVHRNAHTDTTTSLAEPPCIFSGFFPKEQAERFVRSAQGFSEKANFGLGFVYLGYRFGTGCRLVRP